MPELPPSPFPNVNGHEYGRTSVHLALDALALIDWTDINWSTELAPGMTRGSRAKVRGATRGMQTISLDFTVLEREAERIRQYLSLRGAAKRQGYMETFFVLNLTLFEPSLPGSKTVTAIGCRISKDEQAISGGDENPLARKFTCFVTDLLQDGIAAVRENTASGF